MARPGAVPATTSPETALKQGNVKIMDQVAAKQQLFFPGLIKKKQSLGRSIPDIVDPNPLVGLLLRVFRDI